MERSNPILRRLGWKGGLAAGVPIAALAALVAVLLFPAGASSRPSICSSISSGKKSFAPCCSSNKKLSITSVSPTTAKAGSNTVVDVGGSHLQNVSELLVGPKGDQTEQMFWYADNELHFSVTPGTRTGKIQVYECGPHTAWSRDVLHTGTP